MRASIVTKKQHQYFAMIAAKRIRACKGTEKEKARKDCLSHLRASLSTPAATGAINQNVRNAV